MTPRKKPVVEKPADTEADLDEQEPEAEEEQEPERGDPWEEPCPVCGLRGCVRHV